MIAWFLCLTADGLNAGTGGSWHSPQPYSTDLPAVVRTSHESGSTHSSNLPLSFFILNGATRHAVKDSIRITFDSALVTTPLSVQETTAGLQVTLPLSLQRGTAHSYRIEFTDDQTPAALKEFSAGFSTDIRGAGDFLVELEDFDFDRGHFQSGANALLYQGLAYAGQGAISGVDYQVNPERETFADNYRTGEAPNVPLIFASNFERSGYTVEGSWMLFASPGDWFQYTRDLPPGSYEVYAAMSHGIPGGALSARFYQVGVSPRGNPQPTLLGRFDAEGTGSWGENRLVRLLNADGGMPVVIPGGARRTFRFEAGSGAADFLLFIPSGLLSIARVQQPLPSIRIQWVGEGRLLRSTEPNGDYTPVAGGETSPVTLPIESVNRYFRLTPTN